ncbi:MAG: DsrE family protein [Euzebya sp.]
MTLPDVGRRELLVVKATHCLDDPERANLACNIAAVGVASGLTVHLFLAVEGVRLALPDVGEGLTVPHAPPISQLLDSVYALGTVTVCAPCAARRDLSAEDFREATIMGGSAGFVELASRLDATVLVY